VNLSFAVGMGVFLYLVYLTFIAWSLYGLIGLVCILLYSAFGSK